MNNIELAELLKETADKLVEMETKKTEEKYEFAKAVSEAFSSPKKVDLSSIDKPIYTKEEMEELGILKEDKLSHFIKDIETSDEEAEKFLKENEEALERFEKEINEIINKPKEYSAFTKENGEKLLSIRDRTVYKELEHLRLLISKNNNDIQTLCEYTKNEILEGHNLNMKSIDNSFKEIGVTLDKIKESKKIIDNLHNVDYDLKMFNK